MKNTANGSPEQPGYPSSSQLTKLQILAISGLACTLASCGQQQYSVLPGVPPIASPAHQKGSHEGQSTKDNKTSGQKKPITPPLMGKTRIEPERMSAPLAGRIRIDPPKPDRQ